MLWLISTLILVAVVWLWRAGMRPTANTLTLPDDVPATLRFLLNRGIENAEARIQVRHDPTRSIKFVKYIVAQNNVGFVGIFCEQPGLTEAFESFRDALAARGTKYEQSSDNAGQSCLKIDFIRDIESAHQIVRILFDDVFGVRLEQECVAFFKNVFEIHSAKLTGVDHPEPWP